MNSVGIVIDIPFVREDQPRRRRPFLKVFATLVLIVAGLLLTLGAIRGGFWFICYALFSLFLFVFLLVLIVMLTVLAIRGVKAIFVAPEPPNLHFDEADIRVGLRDGAFRKDCLKFLGRYCSELCPFLQRLAKNGVNDLAIRIGKPELLPHIRPIEIFFEPVRLRESTADFNELRRQLESGLDASSQRVGPSNLKREPFKWRDYLLAALAFAVIGSCLAGLGYWVVLIASLLLEAIQSCRPHPFLIWLILFMSVWFGVPAWRRQFRGRWYAVPGGVLVRHGRWWDARWRSRFFDRRSSVLGAVHDWSEDQ